MAFLTVFLSIRFFFEFALLFGLWHHLAPLLMIFILLSRHPLKQKSVMSFRTDFNFLWGILVYSVEKSYVATDLALFLELSFLRALTTGSLFFITQKCFIPEKKCNLRL